MFRTILILALSGALAIGAFAQESVNVPNESAGYYLSGEHYPLTYAGQGLIQGAAHPCTTAWVQIGWSPEAAAAANRNTGRFNPEKFTVGLKLSIYGTGDSAQVSAARFESAYDTTSQAYWNADSSNLFIDSGNFFHQDYGLWRFEALEDTSRRWLYPLRVLMGGYLRLILETELEDSVTVDWIIIGEN